ncbi:MAG: hypothetical protein HW397_346 [Dehalococcoidia bacterium]|nr:hypothetical protein [Dehalococcoidia bacterium]
MPLGLVACRKYKGPGSWEIDHLRVSQGTETAFQEILGEASIALGHRGAERLVLRLPDDSPFHSLAVEMGFSPMLREKAYFRPPLDAATQGAEPGRTICRPAHESDAYRLFRLYCLAVPAAVRQMEAMTIGDWGGLGDSGHLKLERRWVQVSGEQITSVLTLVRGSGRRRLLEVLTNPQNPDDITPLLREAVATEGKRSTLVALLPEYLWTNAVERVMEAQAFQEGALFTVYVKPVMARVRRVGLMPARA